MLSAVVILDRTGEILAMRRFELDNYRIEVIPAK
jgi:hypothetical protein